MMKKRLNVYVTRRIPKVGLDLIKKEIGGFEINPHDRALSRKELLKQVKGRDGVLCLLTDKIDASVMDVAGKQIKIFSNYAVGFDNIDLAEATKRKILITNTPGVLTLATAEMAWSLLFAVARKVTESDRFVRQGKFRGWGPLLFLGNDLSGKTLGVIGTGRIGSAFAMMSKGFNMKVLYASPSFKETLEKELGAKKVDLQTLLKESDFISLHVNLTEATRRMIGKKELGVMKPSAIIINTSRGAVIDELALVKAIKSKKIAGAGLDVYENEPNLAFGLSKLSNVVLTPHLGSATIETRNRMAILAAQNLIAGVKGKVPKYLVNSEVSL